MQSSWSWLVGWWLFHFSSFSPSSSASPLPPTYPHHHDSTFGASHIEKTTKTRQSVTLLLDFHSFRIHACHTHTSKEFNTSVVTVYIQICICVCCVLSSLTSCLASLYLLAGENQRVEQEATLPRKK